MILSNKSNLSAINDKFNFFHDGILKGIEVISGCKPLLNWPWEPKKSFNSNEDELVAVFYHVQNFNYVRLKINHYNYNWPNEPYNRMISIQAPQAVEILDSITSFVGKDISSIGFSLYDDLIECYIIYHEDHNLWSEENSIRRTLFRAPRIRLIEQ